jgi:hypothetical protein
MLYKAREKYPWRKIQTLFPFTVEGVKDAVAQAMAMKTVKSAIVPFLARHRVFAAAAFRKYRLRANPVCLIFKTWAGMLSIIGGCDDAA